MKSKQSKTTLKRLTLDTNPEDCNLTCIMCEEHSPYSHFKEKLIAKTGKKRRVMPQSWLPGIFSEAKGLGVHEIIPSTMGEPLLYNGFETILELCQKHKIKLNLTTNGTFPRSGARQWAKKLVPVCSDIKLSWNGATQQTFQGIMRGSSYAKHLENLKILIDQRNLHFLQGGNYCSLSLQLTFMQNNMHELPQIVELASQMGVDRVKGHHVWVHFVEIEALSFKKDSKSVLKWNEIVRRTREKVRKLVQMDKKVPLLENIVPLPLSENSGEVPFRYECPFLGRELWVSATGKISPCCAPDEQRQSLGYFGTYPQNSLGQVLQSPAYQYLCRNYKQNALCKQCNMRREK